MSDKVYKRNKERDRITHRLWVSNNAASVKQHNLNFYNKRKAIYLDFINKIKAAPCKDCNKEYPHYVMDFDHLRDKKFEINQMRMRRLSDIQSEIAKCEIVCANCHRIRTWTRSHGN